VFLDSRSALKITLLSLSTRGAIGYKSRRKDRSFSTPGKGGVLKSLINAPCEKISAFTVLRMYRFCLIYGYIIVGKLQTHGSRG
jgi:hypothetical protein